MGRIWRVVRDDAKPEDLRRLRQVDLADALDRPSSATSSATPTAGGATRPTGSSSNGATGPRSSRSRSTGRRVAAVAVRAPTVVHALHLLDGARRPPRRPAPHVALQHPAARRPRERPPADRAPARRRPRLARPTSCRCADDPDARVRFQAAIALGAFRGGDQRERDDAWIAAALARVAARDGADRWARAAVFSCALRPRAGLPRARFGIGPGTPAARPDLLAEFGRLLGASRPQETWPELVRLVVAGPARLRARGTGGAAHRARRGGAGAARPRGQGGRPVRPGRHGRGARRPGPRPRRRDDATGPRPRRTARPPPDGRRPAGVRRLRPGRRGAAPARRRRAARRAPDRGRARPRRAPRRPGRVGAPRGRPVRAATPRRSATRCSRPSSPSPTTCPACSRPSKTAASRSARSTPSAADSSPQSRDPDVRRRAEALFGAVSGDRAKVYDEYKERRSP